MKNQKQIKAPIEKEIKTLDNILPSDRIIDIINICKLSNIKNLKYGPLEIEFISSQNQTAAAATDPVKKMFSQMANDDLEELRVSQLMIDDPTAFEQEIIDSHTGRYNAEIEN